MQQRNLGLFSVLALVIGTQLGTAIFLLPGQLSVYGPWALVSWIITGTGALALSHIFSQLSLDNQKAGGPSVYIMQAFGSIPGFLVGWSYWVISWLSSIPVLMVLIGALEHIIGDISPWGRLGFEWAILGSIFWLNIKGANLSRAGEIFFTTLKVVPMLTLPFLSLPYMRWDFLTLPTTMPALKALNAASLLTFWGFIGLETGTTLTGQVQGAKKIIPRALFLGTALVMMIYLLNTGAVMAVVSPSVLQASANPYGLFLETIGGPLWGKAVSFLVLIMCLGTLNSWTLASGQVAMLAAKEGLFPQSFAYVNKKGCPLGGLAYSTLALLGGTLFLKNQGLSQQINDFVNLSTSLFIMIYLLCTIALIRLKSRHSWKTHMALCLGFVFCVWSLLTTPWKILLGCGVIPICGLLIAPFCPKLNVRSK